MPVEGSYETSPERCPRPGCDAPPWQPCQFTTDMGKKKKGDLRQTLHVERRRSAGQRQERQEQPPPVGNGSTPIVDLVVADLHDRKAHGIATYGVPLQADNGRDALRDLYEELMDACCYIRQAIEERDRVSQLAQRSLIEPAMRTDG